MSNPVPRFDLSGKKKGGKDLTNIETSLKMGPIDTEIVVGL